MRKIAPTKARGFGGPTRPPDSDRLRGAIAAALPGIEWETKLLGELRAALLDDDTQAVVAISRRLVGLPPVESKP